MMCDTSGSSRNGVTACKCLSKKRIVDTLLWVSVLVLLILSLVGCIPPRVSGFYCNDQYIREKYTGDTISAGTLLGSCILLPIIMISVIEAVNYKLNPMENKPQRKKRLCGCSRHSGNIIYDYLFSILLILTLTDIIKSMVGEKRPHFLDTCKPTVNCTTSYSSYVADYKCTAKFPKWYLHLDIYKSFPSGHASLSCFMATFMIIYLQNRVSLRLSHLFRPIIQFSFILWAVYCSMSRIFDNRHHWWDVLAGSIIGIIGAFTTIWGLEQKFKFDHSQVESVTEETNLTGRNSTMVIIRNSNAET